MPPKKAAAAEKKQNAQAEEKKDVPTNSCEFRILMDVKHEAGHYHKIKYTWVAVGADGEVTFPVTDTGMLKDWNLIQIEGEEPVAVEEEKDKVDAKKPAAKKGADPKKPAGKLEDITDNRPRQVGYERNCAEEQGGIIEVTEAIAKKFSEARMMVQIIEVNKETQEEKEVESIDLDISCLLFPKDDIDQAWRFDKLKTMELHYLEIRVKSEQPMLSEFYRKKLNPLLINLVSFKDIPFKTEPKYKPIFANLEFIDGSKFVTLEMPQQPACKFMHKHVFLVGQHDPVLFKEMLATKLVRVYLHDCDEYVTEESDAMFSVGQASFTFKDFLRPFCHELKLRSDVFPMKRPEVDNTQNLDLNTTARKNEKTIEKFSPYLINQINFIFSYLIVYLINATYCVLQANLSFPIGAFNEQRELAAAAEEKKSKPTEEEQKQEQEPETLPPSEPLTQEDFLDPNGAIYERMIIIVPYKSPDTVKQVEASFERINLGCLNLENARYLNTKELTDEEKADRSLDFLGGFEIMDSEFRMFILEGLGGGGRSMDQFYRANERQRPNDKKLKMLYNPQVRFKNRMYTDFNCSIKKIRLRDTLTKIMGSPDVYLRSKVPEDMYDTLQKFAEIRKQDRASLVRDFNLYPITANLLTLERKYGDSLNFEDLNGYKQRKRRQRKVADGATEVVSEGRSEGKTNLTQTDALSESRVSEGRLGAGVTVASSARGLDTKPATAVADDEESHDEEEEPPKKRNPDTDARNPRFEQSLRDRASSQPPNFQYLNKQTVTSMNTGRPLKQRIEVPDGVEVYPYGNQQMNIWEFQKEQLRKHIANDPSNFYTYSKEHLSLAFPLVNENEIKMKEKEASEAKWKTKAGFDTLNKKTKLILISLSLIFNDLISSVFET